MKTLWAYINSTLRFQFFFLPSEGIRPCIWEYQWNIKDIAFRYNILYTCAIFHCKPWDYMPCNSICHVILYAIFYILIIILCTPALLRLTFCFWHMLHSLVILVVLLIVIWLKNIYNIFQRWWLFKGANSWIDLQLTVFQLNDN